MLINDFRGIEPLNHSPFLPHFALLKVGTDGLTFCTRHELKSDRNYYRLNGYKVSLISSQIKQKLGAVNSAFEDEPFANESVQFLQSPLRVDLQHRREPLPKDQ